MLIPKIYIWPVLLSIGYLISGCASGPSVHSQTIGASHEIEAPKAVTKANIGIFYEPSLANYIHIQSISDSIATMNVGQESVGLFNVAIPQVFEKAELIDKLPPYDIPKSELDGIVEPRLDYVSWRMFFDSEEDFFHVAYTFLFYSSEGVPISTWTIIGEGKYLKDQLADAAQKFVDGFPTAPETKEFRAYLENKQVGKLGFDVNDINIQASLVDENELGLKLKEAGILPVQITVTNETNGEITGRGFDVRFIYSDGRRLVPAFPLAVVSSFEYKAATSASDPAMVGTFFGLPGLFGTMFGSHSERVEIRKKQASYFEKARLKEVTLARGESIQGILYFVLPSDVTQINEATLSFWFIDPSVANGKRKEISLSGIDYKIGEATESASKKVTNIYAPAITTEPVNFTGDFSGTYISSTSDGVVRIIQDGNKITGSFGNKGGRIWGDIEGNTIKFDYSYPTGGSGVGKWLFTTGSSEVTGAWDSSTRSRSGKWNLTKIK